MSTEGVPRLFDWPNADRNNSRVKFAGLSEGFDSFDHFDKRRKEVILLPRGSGREHTVHCSIGRSLRTVFCAFDPCHRQSSQAVVIGSFISGSFYGTQPTY